MAEPGKRTGGLRRDHDVVNLAIIAPARISHAHARSLLEIPPMILATRLALTLALAVGGQDAWYEPFPAHRVIGNVYYVGSKDLATYLITTPDGHILINSGFERTVPLIR